MNIFGITMRINLTSTLRAQAAEQAQAAANVDQVMTQMQENLEKTEAVLRIEKERADRLENEKLARIACLSRRYAPAIRPRAKVPGGCR